jgi:hypothetical protein
MSGVIPRFPERLCASRLAGACWFLADSSPPLQSQRKKLRTLTDRHGSRKFNPSKDWSLDTLGQSSRRTKNTQLYTQNLESK